MDLARRSRQAPDTRDLTRYLPQVALATGLVLGLPALTAAWLQAALGLPAIPSMLAAVVLSLLAANLGAAYWMRRPESRNLVFGDLMVWGWLRRLRAERRLSEAAELLGARRLDDDAHVEVLTRLASGLEARDPYTSGHSKRVTRYSEMIAERMGLAEADVAKVRTAAAVHDVGKINTPREVLMKPGRLTDAEFAIIQRHAEEGAAMVAAIGDDEITAIVRSHHERLDGSGYPDGASGDDVPLGARIIAVADAFDAMTSSRPYRPARPHKRAIEILDEEAGTKLDARAVAAFHSCYSARRSIAWSALLVAVPQRLASWAGSALGSGGAAPLTTGLSALGAAALLGGSVMGPVALGDEETARSGSDGGSPVSQARAARDPGDDDRGTRSEGAGPRRETASDPGSRLRPSAPQRDGSGGDAYQGPASQGGSGGPAPGGNPAPPQQRPIPPTPPTPTPRPLPPPPVEPPAVPQIELPDVNAPEVGPLNLNDVVNDVEDLANGVGGLANSVGD